MGAEARHAVTVSRIRLGESLSIGNGAGLVVTGTVVEAHADELSIEAATVRRCPRAMPALVLVQALAKGGRDELAIQAATELGVDAVIPWAAQRSVVALGRRQRAAKGRDRWDSIVREASKQSPPRLAPACCSRSPSTEQLARLAAARIGCSCSSRPPSEPLTAAACATDDRDLVLVVGPEGGIAPEELERSTAAGATPVRLGDTVLRTSTAGPAAIAVLNARLGRW